MTYNLLNPFLESKSQWKPLSPKNLLVNLINYDYRQK